MATSRLNKRMAELGLCSRREADEWVENGWVKVNGEVAVMGQLVVPSDRIEIDRAAQDRQEQQVTILLHKPMGYVSGQAEDGLSLLVLPLYIPVLIFGAGAVEATATGMGAQAHLSLLAALSLGGVFFAPWATAAAIRIALE